jgi:hypothetical protein
LLAAHLDSCLAISLISVDDQVVRLTAHPVSASAACPDCRRPSSQVHDT